MSSLAVPSTGIRRHGHNPSATSARSTGWAQPQHLCLHSQSRNPALQHERQLERAGAGEITLPSSPWKDGETSAQQGWIWYPSLACKPCLTVPRAHCRLDAPYGAALWGGECYRPVLPMHLLTLFSSLGITLTMDCPSAPHHSSVCDTRPCSSCPSFLA